MMCFHCGVAGAVFACGRCHAVYFCGPSCQKGGWTRHKPDCVQAAETCSGGSTGSLPSSASPTARPPTSPNNTSAALLRAMAVKASSRCVRVYPNVGVLQGEIDVELAPQSTQEEIWEALRRVLFRDTSARPRLRIFGADGEEVLSVPEFWGQASKGGVVVSANLPLRGASIVTDNFASCQPRYDRTLVGSSCCRISADDPEVESLLRAPVPVVISDSNMAGEALKRWSFEYLERHLADVDNFFVLCSPEMNQGRFSYYDLSEGKNPCDYKVVPNNRRVEMRFPEFRRKVEAARGKKRGDLYYLQNTLLHREERDAGAPRPVGRFGLQCGCQVARDIDAFRWDWLKKAMGREPQMCQLFCGSEGFSPCHYDPQDNVFLQVTGYKRVLLFHPRHFGCLYPWPVHHPQDRQSRVDFEEPDLQSFPRFAELKGQGIEAILGPGDLLHIPPGWWHHVEMLPSPRGEVVSFNFWYPPPTWFDGDLSKGQISWDKPLFGVRRTLFQRCVEELIAQVAQPSKVPDVLRLAIEGGQGGQWQQALEHLETFLGPVLSAGERRQLLLDVLQGRFTGLES